MNKSVHELQLNHMKVQVVKYSISSILYIVYNTDQKFNFCKNKFQIIDGKF